MSEAPNETQSAGGQFSFGGFFEKAADFYIAKETAKAQAAAGTSTATAERTAVTSYTAESTQNIGAQPWGVDDFSRSLGESNPYLGLNNGLLLLIALGLAIYLFKN